MLVILSEARDAAMGQNVMEVVLARNTLGMATFLPQPFYT